MKHAIKDLIDFTKILVIGLLDIIFTGNIQ